MSLKPLYPLDINMDGASLEATPALLESQTPRTQPPIILFPGILGNSSELKYLAEMIDKNSEQQRCIYAYENDRLNSNKLPQESSIDISEQVTSIVKELSEGIASHTPYPFMLVGYSYGCTLATLVAQKLKEQGHDPHVFLIDGVAPHVSQSYYLSSQKTNTQTIEDMLSILNYAATLSDLENLQLSSYYDSSHKKFLKQFNSMPKQFASIQDELLNHFNKIKEQILAINLRKDSELKSRFQSYAAVAQQNLNNLLKILLPDPPLKLDKISILMVEATKEKYQKENGWYAYSQNIDIIQTSELKHHTEILAKKQHIELLKKENCDHLANIIINTFEQEISQQKIFENGLFHCLVELQKNYPSVDVRLAAKRYYDNSPLNSSSSNSDQSDDDNENEYTEENNKFKREVPYQPEAASYPTLFKTGSKINAGPSSSPSPLDNSPRLAS